MNLFKCFMEIDYSQIEVLKILKRLRGTIVKGRPFSINGADAKF